MATHIKQPKPKKAAARLQLSYEQISHLVSQLTDVQKARLLAKLRAKLQEEGFGHRLGPELGKSRRIPRSGNDSARTKKSISRSVGK